jgi:AhpD family alkylhydroperoxidase
MEKSRVNLGKAAPQPYQAVTSLDKLVKDLTNSAASPRGFVHLLRLRASQINQCAYCVRLHSSDALKTVESSDRISVLTARRESGYVTDKERAALLLTEAVTRIAKGQVPDAIYEEAAAALNEQEIAAVEWLAILMNVWTRIALSSRYPVKP